MRKTQRACTNTRAFVGFLSESSRSLSFTLTFKAVIHSSECIRMRGERWDERKFSIYKQKIVENSFGRQKYNFSLFRPQKKFSSHSSCVGGNCSFTDCMTLESIIHNILGTKIHGIFPHTSFILFAYLIFII
jgi:hypothetical protein